MQNTIKKLSDIITGYLDAIGLFEQSEVLKVYSSWTRIVGEKYAAHAKLIDIRHHTAFIETDHPGWSQQLLLNKRYILRNFQKNYPQLDVKNISVISVSSYNNPYPSHYRNTTQQREEKISENQVKQRGESSINGTTALPSEIQNALERLRLSIIRKNK